MANLGFVGLGVMGSRIVKRLLDAGHTVMGHNRTKSKGQWLLDAGMKWGDTPRAVAEAADVTFSMVTNTPPCRRNERP
jgi:3-hydroxyisobutyrate dehydrogenase-like beta-hydroxyacid dehydrogenase